MNRDDCKQTSLHIAALRSGKVPHGLEEHVASCRTCAETVGVAQSLLRYAALTSAQSQPPSAKRVWRQMQEKRRDRARKRATGALTAMWVLATAYLIGVAAWYLPSSLPTSSTGFQGVYDSLSNRTFFIGITAAAFSIVLGALAVLFTESRIKTLVSRTEEKQ